MGSSSRLLSADIFQTLRLQLVLGADRAEVSLDDLERLENRPLCQELGVILRALTVVAATNVLGWKMTDGIPTPAAGCCGIGVDGSCQLVVATVAHVAKAIEVSILRLDEPEPGVPQRVSPVQGLEQRRVHLTSAACPDCRLLPKTRDSVHVTANKPGTRCRPKLTHLSRRRSFGHGSARGEFGRTSNLRVELDDEQAGGTSGGQARAERKPAGRRARGMSASPPVSLGVISLPGRQEEGRGRLVEMVS
jgi:hypothetical protein